MSWTSWLNPLNWPKNISGSFVGQVENALLYIFTLILDGILSIISSILGILMTIFQSFVTLLVNASISMGPFSLPVFVIGSAAMISFTYLAFAMVKDMPVVGAFA